MDHSNLPQPSRPSGIPRMSRLPLPKSSIPQMPTAQPSTVRKTPSKSTLAARSRIPNDTQSKTTSKLFSTTSGRLAKSVNSTTKPLASNTSAYTEPPAPTSPSSSQIDTDEVDEADQLAGGEPTTPNMRMSLAERTVESIAKIPPTPQNGRRRSSFFNSESPMPSRSRPQLFQENGSRPSSKDGVTTAPDIPPVPPIKTPLKANLRKPAISQVNGRGSASTASPTPRTTGAAKVATSKTVRPSQKASTTKPVTRPLHANNTSSQPAQSRVSNPRIRNESTPRRAVKGSNSKNAEAVESPKPSANTSKSSAALREQIRQAKAARKSSNAKAPEPTPSSSVTETDTFIHDDPFNQGLSGGALVMRKRVDTARVEGRLNISAMGLKEFPEEVLMMYDYEYNKKESGIAWGEVVDLTRFIAADNQLERIPDECFPDVDVNSLTQDDDVPGPQFGGIEYLDLHGNLLNDVPVGLRQLGRLTSLNLSRNRLKNDTLQTIAQITTLKELKLIDNELSGDLNPAIGNLTELEVLELQGNKLAALPSEIVALVQLRILNISNNQFSALPMAELCELSLTQLLASKNRLSGTLFTQSNAQMPRLQQLDLSMNSLQSLSSGTLTLPLLKELNIAFNRLSSLPNMSSWNNLSDILAEDNKITGLPEGFTDMTQLRSADFTGNDFSKLDSRIGSMSGLENIKFAANPIRERKFLTMGTADIKRDLRARLGLDQPGQEVD